MLTFTCIGIETFRRVEIRITVIEVRERKLVGDCQRWKELVLNEYFVHLVFWSCSSATHLKCVNTKVSGKIPALCWRHRTLDSCVWGWERHSDGIIHEWTLDSGISQASHPREDQRQSWKGISGSDVDAYRTSKACLCSLPPDAEGNRRTVSTALVRGRHLPQSSFLL